MEEPPVGKTASMIERRVESVTDRLAQTRPLRATETLLGRAGESVRGSEALTSALSGSWLGHRLHPMLTDAPIGFWLSAGLVDWMAGERGEKAADRLVEAGLVSSLPTALAGLSDWNDTRGPQRRMGVVHAVANTLALALQAASAIARHAGKRRTARRLSALALVSLGAGGYLGGHLSYAHGVGVAHDALESPPDDWVRVLEARDLEDRAVVTAGGQQVLIVRRDGGLYAMADTCSHAGCSLSQGQFDESTVVCACHGSTFELATGDVVRGPAASSQRAYEVRFRDGGVEVRPATPQTALRA